MFSSDTVVGNSLTFPLESSVQSARKDYKNKKYGRKINASSLLVLVSRRLKVERASIRPFDRSARILI